MEERVRAFTGAGAPLDKTTDWQPPDMMDDYMARLLALVVERLGGQATITRDEVREVPGRLMVLVREIDDSLIVETRRLATEPTASG